jgi:hypothetical protein
MGSIVDQIAFGRDVAFLRFVALTALLIVGIVGPQSNATTSMDRVETVQKLVIANGNVTMDLDLDLAAVEPEERKCEKLQFEIDPNSFFTIRVNNNILRGSEQGTMNLISRNSATSILRVLAAPLGQLIIERTQPGEPFDRARFQWFSRF